MGAPAASSVAVQPLTRPAHSSLPPSLPLVASASAGGTLGPCGPVAGQHARDAAGPLNQALQSLLREPLSQTLLRMPSLAQLALDLELPAAMPQPPRVQPIQPQVVRPAAPSVPQAVSPPAATSAASQSVASGSQVLPRASPAQHDAALLPPLPQRNVATGVSTFGMSSLAQCLTTVPMHEHQKAWRTMQRSVLRRTLFHLSKALEEPTVVQSPAVRSLLCWPPSGVALSRGA